MGYGKLTNQGFSALSGERAVKHCWHLTAALDHCQDNNLWVSGKWKCYPPGSKAVRKKWALKDEKSLGLPWWLSGKESACQCRRQGFDPWSGKISHATMTKPAHHDLSRAPEPGEPQPVTLACSTASGLQQENPERRYWWAYGQGGKGDTDVETDFCTQLKRRGWEDVSEQHWNIHTTVRETASRSVMRDAGRPKWMVSDSQRDGLGREAGEGLRMEGTRVCPGSLHADIRQNHHNIVK